VRTKIRGWLSCTACSGGPTNACSEPLYAHVNPITIAHNGARHRPESKGADDNEDETRNTWICTRLDSERTRIDRAVQVVWPSASPVNETTSLGLPLHPNVNISHEPFADSLSLKRND
jgi:hypothetical protein